MQIRSDMTLYRVRVNMITGEPNYMWVQAESRQTAKHHIKYNLHPRGTISNITPNPTPEKNTTIHTIIDNEIKTERLTQHPETT